MEGPDERSARAGAGLPERPRVLLLRLSALGDLVFALPVLHALHQALPGCRVDWLAEDRCADLPRSHPLVAETLVFPRRRWRRGLGAVPVTRHLLGLRRLEPWDLVLDLQSNLKSALHLRFLRARLTLGFAPPVGREGAWRFVDHAVEVTEPRLHRSERDLELVRAAGIAAGPARTAAWPLPPGVEAPDEVADSVLLHVTTTAYGRDKEWPPERWAELARRLADRGLQPRALWTPADRDRVAAVVEDAGGALGWAPPTPTLAHLMATCDRARALVGTDSGPVHLAAHRGAPVVALFGPTDARVYAPLGPRVRVVHSDPLETPPPPRDRSRRSPLMERIGVDEVVAALADLEVEG